MFRHRRWLIGLLVFCAFASSAQGSDLSKFLDGLFRDVNNRAPTGSELNYHADIARESGPLESAIQMYGSDDYYVRQCHRDGRLFVTQLYQAFLGRAPRVDELQYWGAQLQRPGVSRVDVVRWFCQSNHITHLPSLLPRPPVYSVPTTPSAIAAGLYGKSRLLVNSLTAELGTTYFGGNVLNGARKFQSVADQYRQVIGRGTPEQIRIVVAQMESSLRDVESRFYRIPGSHPQSNIALQQVSQLVTAARNAISAWGRPPIGTRPPVGVPRPPVGMPPGNRPPSPDVGRLLEASRRFSYGLLSYQSISPFYDNLIRDVQGLSTQIESLALMIRQGQSRPALRQSMWAVIDQARHVSQDVARTDMKVQRGWMNLQSEITSFATSLGVDAQFNAQPSRPVIINRPAWPSFPYQPGPAYPTNHAEEAVVLADRLAAQCDQAIQSLMIATASNPSAMALSRSLKNFKQYVAVFRQAAVRGSFSTSLSSAADRLMSQYQLVSREAAAVISRDPSLNSPVLYQMGELVRQIQDAARGLAR